MRVIRLAGRRRSTMLPPPSRFSPRKNRSTSPARSSTLAADGCSKAQDLTMKALTAAEMREVDRLTTERFGVPGLQLMESAGQSVAEEFLDKYGHRRAVPPGQIAVLCGKGNNGGDGFVVARHLKEEAAEVTTYLFAKPDELRGDALKNFECWRDAGGSVTTILNEGEWEKAF